MEKRMERAIAGFRSGIMALISDESLYLLFAFLFAGVLNSDLFVWQREQIDLLDRYVMIPWGIMLCVLRLVRADAKTLMKPDTGLLTLLFLWVTAPFLLRFGVTFNNITSAVGHAVAFFAVYATTREEAPQSRDAMLNRLCAGFALLSFVWGGMLLLSAWTGYTFEHGAEIFGVTAQGMLQAGVHYNHTGMSSITMLMMCLVGVSRARGWPARIACAVPAAMMALVVVLTQSRTARYSMLLAFAVGTYGALCVRLAFRRAWLRPIAALAAACAVLVGGYVGADRVTEAALAHYSGRTPIIAQAAVEEAEAEAGEAPLGQEPVDARVAVDATFSDRTNIWRNLIDLWKEEPKYMIIGNGVGRTGSRIVEDTIHESAGAVAVHNTYLQLVADFGLIGAGMLLAFFAVVFRPALRVFFAPPDGSGGRALCMLVTAVLATGMMESQPLGAMTPMNMMLYYALAVLCAKGRQLQGKHDSCLRRLS